MAATGWTLLGNTSIVAANEPWHVRAGHARAPARPRRERAELAAAGRACSTRGSASSPDSVGANGQLHVQVIFRGLLGNLTGLLNVGSLSPSGYASWQPTQRRCSSALALPLLTTSAQVLLTSQATSGSWQVDDLYLDPCVAKLG